MDFVFFSFLSFRQLQEVAERTVKKLELFAVTWAIHLTSLL